METCERKTYVFLQLAMEVTNSPLLLNPLGLGRRPLAGAGRIAQEGQLVLVAKVHIILITAGH